MAFLIPGYKTLAEFCREVNLPYMTVANQMKAGYCKWPYKPSPKRGVTKHPLYKTWDSMIGRCYCKSNASYSRYGQVGIKVCERWKTSIDNFLQDMASTYPGPEYTLDRLNPKGHYEPENCRWATQREQRVNIVRKLEAGIIQEASGKWSCIFHYNCVRYNLGRFACKADAIHAKKIKLQSIGGGW